MDTLTHNELFCLITKSKGTLIVGLLALVDCRARKTGNPYGKINKQVRAVGFVGAEYQTAVNNEAMRQDQSAMFQAEALPWGQWLIPGKVIVHNGQLYLRTQTTPGNRRKQPAKVIAYRDSSGKFLSRDDVKPFLPTPRESSKQQEQTGIEKTVWVRTYAFSSIQTIRISGKTYKLVADKLGSKYGNIPQSLNDWLNQLPITVKPNYENTPEAKLSQVTIEETDPSRN